MLARKYWNVRFWLGTVLTAPDKQRLLLPQQPTFQPARRFRIVFVCFWGMSGPTTGLSVESEVDTGVIRRA